MEIRATHNTFIYNFFKWYTSAAIRLFFRQVFIKGELIDTGKPILAISNHISWWDGFWVMYLNMKCFKRKFFFFMMQEDQLEKHRFFRKTGGYPVKKGSRSIIESLSYTKKLLTQENNMVLLFPQGKIESAQKREISFGKGVLKVIKESDEDVQIIFIFNIVDYYSGPRPELYMYFTVYKSNSQPNPEEAYRSFYSGVINEHMNPN
jgi:1-acyl-sn-glycerol-3-phosphate acyltransferase